MDWLFAPRRRLVVLHDSDGWLAEGVDVVEPWSVDFWFGGWDADLLCGFTRGTIHLGADVAPPPPIREAEDAIQRRP